MTPGPVAGAAPSAGVAGPLPAVAVALLPDQRSPVAACAEYPWALLCDELTSHQVGEKEAPAWMPARIPPGPRTGARVQAVTAVVLDIEARTERTGSGKRVTGPLPPPLDEIARRLQARGLAAALATTHSHEAPAAGGGTLGPRYRVVLPLSRELAPLELRPLALQVAAELGLSDVVDRSCMEPARLLYLPRAPADRLHLAQRATVPGAAYPVPTVGAGGAIRTTATATLPGPAKWLEHPEAERARVVAELRNALDATSSDDRATWVSVGMALKADLPHDLAFQLWADWSQSSAKFQDGDLDQFETFEPDHTGHAAVFKIAAVHGWVNPRSAAARDLSKVGFGVGVTLPPGARPVTAAANAEQLQVIDLSTLAAFEPPPEFWWEGRLPAGEVTLLAGHGGQGKSMVALVLAVCVATGLPCFGVPVKRGRALFYSGEDGARTVRYRLREVCRAMGLEPAALVGWLTVIDATGDDPTLYALADDRRKACAPTAALCELRAILSRQAVDVLVVDNMSDVFGGDEINRSQVRGFVRALAQLVRTRGGAVLLLAHVGKATSRAGSKSQDAESYSGSTALHNSVRSRLFLAPTDTPDLRELRQEKSNHGKLQPVLRLSWASGLVPSAVAPPVGIPDDEAMAAFLKAVAGAGDARLSDSKNSQFFLPKVIANLRLLPAGLDTVRAAELMNLALRDGNLARESNTDANRKPYVALKLRNFAAAAQGAQGS